MTFLFDVNRQIGFGELIGLHKAACRPEDITKDCLITLPPVNGVNQHDAGLPIAWLDGPLGGTIQPDGSVTGAKEHGGILSGALRKYQSIDEPRYVDIETAGRLHGVSNIIE